MSWPLVFLHSSVDDAGLDANTFRVLLHIVRRADGSGIAFPSVKSAAKICRLNKDTVAKAFRELVKAGWIKRIKRPGLSSAFALQEPIRNEGISETKGYPSKSPPLSETRGYGVIRNEGSEGNPYKVIQEGDPLIAVSGEFGDNGTPDTSVNPVASERHSSSSAAKADQGESPPVRTRRAREKSAAAPRAGGTGFAAFWAAYPHKIGKRDAERAWTKHSPPLDKVLAAVEAWRNSPAWLKEGGRFIPHPTTWLNRGGWEDELPVVRQQPESFI